LFPYTTLFRSIFCFPLIIAISTTWHKNPLSNFRTLRYLHYTFLPNKIQKSLNLKKHPNRNPKFTGFFTNREAKYYTSNIQKQLGEKHPPSAQNLVKNNEIYNHALKHISIF